MISRTWREIAAPIIRDVLAQHAGADPSTILKALREAYPFGEREMWPYKVWCDEIRVQTGKKTRRIPGRRHYTDEKQLTL